MPSIPDVALIRELYFLYRDRGYDAIIALGGDAVADTAKVLNIAVVGKPEDLERYAGDGLLEKPLKPFIMIPTFPAIRFIMENLLNVIKNPRDKKQLPRAGQCSLHGRLRLFPISKRG